MGDLRYATRLLAREPGFAAVILLTIALGIGGATAIFSVVHAVLLRSLPYHDESRIVMVWETEPAAGVDKMVGTPGNFQDWRAQTRTIDHLGALMDFEATLTGRGEPRRVKSRRVSASVFTALGVQPLIGRTFVADDERDGTDAVLLAHHTWQELFGADPNIVGEKITLHNGPRTVIGVMRPEFRLPRGSDDLWIPRAQHIRATSPRFTPAARDWPPRARHHARAGTGRHGHDRAPVGGELPAFQRARGAVGGADPRRDVGRAATAVNHRDGRRADGHAHRVDQRGQPPARARLWTPTGNRGAAGCRRASPAAHPATAY